MTVLVFGCSVAHGADTREPGNHPENIKNSYGALLAKYLGQPCENYAFCGNSNENIFHAAMKKIFQTPTITALIVGWTSPVRETWECDERIWQVIPRWCSTTKDIYKPFQYFKKNQFADTVYQTSADQFEHMQSLDEIYNCLIKYKFDEKVYAEKTSDYILALRAVCNQQNIKLLETCWYDPVEGAFDLALVGDWLKENRWLSRHPDKVEHQQMCEAMIKFYKL